MLLLCDSLRSNGTTRRVTRNPATASATETPQPGRPTTPSPTTAPHPFRRPQTAENCTPGTRASNSPSRCNPPCLLISCRLRAPLLQEHPILLQCAHSRTTPTEKKERE